MNFLFMLAIQFKVKDEVPIQTLAINQALSNYKFLTRSFHTDMQLH